MFVFHVPGMKCDGCLAAVTRAVQNLDRSARITADLGKREIHVRSHQPEALILAALKEAHYPAVPVLQPSG